MHETPNIIIEADPQLQFKQKLNDILYTKVSVENINQFAESALEDLVELNESVVRTYINENAEVDSHIGVELEDKAYEAYGLDNLNTILTRIEEVREKIATITASVTGAMNEVDEVITPPDSTGPEFNAGGNNTYEAPQHLDRLVTLAYILERDFDLDQSEVTYTKGITTDNMMRQEPYIRVEIKDLERVVYVCDEEGNASYVFDTEVLDLLDIQLPDLDVMSKNQRNALIRVSPEAGKRIIQSSEWRKVMSAALGEEFVAVPNVEASEEVVPRSEFAERVKPLEYTEFQTEVQAAYGEAGSPPNIFKWYLAEQKTHPGWPYHPERQYKDSGYAGYQELVGKDGFLSLDTFVSEVRTAYEEAGSPEGVQKWYRTENKAHLNWPTAPHETYKDSGWIGMNEIVGKKRVEFLPFNTFLTEIRTAYQTARSPKGATVWYKKEYKHHPGWPSQPLRQYESECSSYAELLDRDNMDHLHEHLPFVDFQEEVKKSYEAAESPAGVSSWYRTEVKKHSSWPRHPNKKYKDSGWVGYLELIGKERVDFSEFSDFVSEVRTAYEEAGSPRGIKSWYETQYKKKLSWPADPSRVYKDSGWVGYPELIDKERVEFLSFNDFAEEVKAAYETAGSPTNISKWYQTEQKSQPGWPYHPERNYKDSGWIGYQSLVN